MKCAWEGCARDVQSALNAVWCLEHRRLQNASREARRRGKAYRQAVRPHEHRVNGAANKRMAQEAPHVTVIHCKVCAGMPHAREPGRMYEPHGNDCRGPKLVAPHGRCVGCGGAYEPEPKAEMCGTIRSSAGMAADHGSLYGSNISVKATGSRRT